MGRVDRLLSIARERANGAPDDQLRIRRKTLGLFVAEIDKLRSEVQAVTTPNQNAIGQFHTNAQDTERAAALAVYPRSGKQRERVLLAIANSPDGLTDAEVAEMTGIYLYSAAPRRNELLIGGWVEKSDRTRTTGNGGDGIVWVATAKTRAVLKNQRTHRG